METLEKGTNYKSLLCTETRDFLVCNNGDQVKVEEAVGGKKIGVYFAAHWCPPCEEFTPKLAEVYMEIHRDRPGAFEVIFVSADSGEEEFQENFFWMPWLAVPFSDEAGRRSLEEAFGVVGFPHLAIIDGRTWEMLEGNAMHIVREYGAEAFPFTKEKVEELRNMEEEAKENQTVMSVLATASRDYLLANDGSKVRISDLEGKIVGIYFSALHDGGCAVFFPILSKMYSDLKQQGEDFEVVLVSLDLEEEDYEEQTEEMPWLALPFKDQSTQKLLRYFELDGLPTLVLLGADGKTLNYNVVEIVIEHGVNAFPFSHEKLAELAELEDKRLRDRIKELFKLSSQGDQ